MQLKSAILVLVNWSTSMLKLRPPARPNVVEKRPSGEEAGESQPISMSADIEITCWYKLKHKHIMT